MTEFMNNPFAGPLTYEPYEIFSVDLKNAIAQEKFDKLSAQFRTAIADDFDDDLFEQGGIELKYDCTPLDYILRGRQAQLKFLTDILIRGFYEGIEQRGLEPMTIEIERGFQVDQPASAQFRILPEA
jgi:hypothetical protein